MTLQIWEASVLQAAFPPIEAARWPRAGGMRPATARRQIGLATAVFAHAALIFVAVRLASAPIAAAPELAGIPIVFTAPPVAVRLASTALPAQPPLAVPAPLALRIAPRIYVVPAVSRPSRSPQRQALAAPATSIIAAPPPTNVPVENPAELTGFKTQVDAAVRAAAAMPEAARRQHRTGDARVRFRYLDGAVDQVEIIESSQSHLLDDAAITAVRAAHYPVPPADIRGHRLELLVRIDFGMDRTPG